MTGLSTPDRNENVTQDFLLPTTCHWLRQQVL